MRNVAFAGNGGKALRFAADAACVVAAAAVCAFGINVFIAPNNIAPGGVTGIAIVINALTGADVGMMIMLINLPLIAAGFFWLGRRQMALTLISVAALGFFTDVAFKNIPRYAAEDGGGILAAIFGGACMGAALGITYARDGTSGGTDIIAKMIAKIAPSARLGTIQLLLDGAVIAAGAAVYRDINVVLYAAVAVFVQSKLIDTLVYGTVESRLVLIFSDKSDAVTKRLLREGRGATLLKGKGAYSGADKNVIVTAVKRSAYAKIKRIIRDTDPLAFVVTAAASEVLGEGFSGE